MECKKEMVLKTIKMEVVKNIGNYQTVRYSVDYEVNEEDAQDVFAKAKNVIEEAHRRNYSTQKNSK